MGVLGASDTEQIQERAFEDHPPGNGRQRSESNVSPPLRTTIVRSFTDRSCGNVKMLRDRYKKWSINDKNCKPKNKPQRRVAAAPKSTTTQMALRMSPRIVELEDDETQVVQDLAGSQNESGLLRQKLRLVDLHTGRPRAALPSIDPGIHEILNGLLDWCDAGVNFPSDEDRDTTDTADPFHSITSALLVTRRNEQKRAWRRCVDAFSVGFMLLELRCTGSLTSLICFFFLIRCYTASGIVSWLDASPVSRILPFLCRRVLQVMGPRHPVTLLCIWTADGLPLTALTDILEAIFQIEIQRESIMLRRRSGDCLSGKLELSSSVAVSRNLLTRLLAAMGRTIALFPQDEAQDGQGNRLLSPEPPLLLERGVEQFATV